MSGIELPPQHGIDFGTLNLGVPTVESAVYRLAPFVFLTWPNGRWNQWAPDLYGEPSKLQESFAQALPHISWVEFYASTVIKLRHTEHVEPSYYHDDGIETLSGSRVKIADAQYVVGRTENGLEFLTADQILEEGELRPGMREWFEPFVRLGNMTSTDTRKFEDLL